MSAPPSGSSALRLILRDRDLRTVALMSLLFGAVVCSFGPYTSLLAVKEFGLGDRGYATLMVISTVIGVSASLFVGIRADQTAGRRRIALGSCALTFGGAALMTTGPAPATFVLTHALILPMASTLFGQIFAQARLASLAHPAEARDGIMATVRALFALPFVAVLPLWAVAFTAGAPLLGIYPVCLVLAGGMTLLTWRSWPADGSAGSDRPSGLSFGAALRELAQAPLALRVLALGAVNASATTYMALLGLVLVPEVGRGTPDVALYAGLVAGLEVPFMLAMPLLSRRAERTKLIAAGTVLYCVHLLGLPLLAGSPLLWLLILPAAAGGAVILTLPIAYLQDLLAARPGTGASLMALQKVAGDVLAALCFALGTAVSGYGLVAVLGTAVALGGALTLSLADRRQ